MSSNLNTDRWATPRVKEEIRQTEPEPEPEDPEGDFESTEDFKKYINNKLREFTQNPQNPLSKLKNELEEFLGTDSLPSDFIGGVMEFELEPQFHRYKFVRIIEYKDVPFLLFRVGSNKRYFEYEYDDDAIAMELVEH